jgi:hypothetical protein
MKIDDSGPPDGPEPPPCTIMRLPDGDLLAAADTAAAVNPANRPAPGPLAALLGPAPGLPLAIAVATSKYWGAGPVRLSVSFLDLVPGADLRARILAHMNAWGAYAAVRFVEARAGGTIRVSRDRPGYWSYLGTDVLHVPPDQPTMNLQGFSMATPESEFHRVVRHEAGHTLGFPHEHMRRDIVARIDPERAYAYFGATQGWSRLDVDRQVLAPLDERSLMGTAADATSIMCYQLPGSITVDGRPIPGGLDIDPADGAFAARVYPRAAPAPGMEELSSLLMQAMALLEAARAAREGAA